MTCNFYIYLPVPVWHLDAPRVGRLQTCITIRESNHLDRSALGDERRPEPQPCFVHVLPTVKGQENPAHWFSVKASVSITGADSHPNCWKKPMLVFYRFLREIFGSTREFVATSDFDAPYDSPWWILPTEIIFMLHLTICDDGSERRKSTFDNRVVRESGASLVAQAHEHEDVAPYCGELLRLEQRIHTALKPAKTTPPAIICDCPGCVN